jgi:serpin B
MMRALDRLPRLALVAGLVAALPAAPARAQTTLRYKFEQAVPVKLRQTHRTRLVRVPAPEPLAADTAAEELRKLEGGNKPATQADVAAVVKGNSEFAFDLYGKLRVKDGNLFFSPNSISAALAMTYAGARGETAVEMARTLHFTLDQDKLHPAFAALLKEQNGGGKQRGYQLSVANALWGQKGFPFKADFLRLTKEHYGGGFQEVDFARNTEAARREINRWVEQRTEDKIKDLLPEGVLNNRTGLVLTNAIYFKGGWDIPFDKDQTREDTFQVSPGQAVKAPLMRLRHQKGEFKYLDGGSFQALELPYAGRHLAMLVLLPKKLDGLAALEETLTADTLAVCVSRLRKQEVMVTLPKFQTTAAFSLQETLSALGMRQAFDRTRADFSGQQDGRDLLFLSAVVHKAYVGVNEEGTEAAAATAVVEEIRSGRAIPVFRADHPFVFLIRDTRNGSILFLGRVVNPAK